VAASVGVQQGLERGSISRGAAGLAQLLSQLQHMQQLVMTHLNLTDCCWHIEEGNPPAAAFSAFTTSSKLQYLHISGCKLAAGALQHIFPTDRQLSHLQELYVQGIHIQPQAAAHLDCSRRAGSCSGLCVLDMSGSSCSAKSLALVTGLSGLRVLHLTLPLGCDMMKCICQLTGLTNLKQLRVDSSTAYRQNCC
jgi:hypothetical protein